MNAKSDHDTRESGWNFYIQLTGERPHSYGPFFASLEHLLPVTRKKENVKNRLFILLTVIHLPSTFENLLGWRLGWRSASLSLHQSLGLRRHQRGEVILSGLDLMKIR